MNESLPRTLFVGKSITGITWYRCALPAMALGQDWVGVTGDPPDLVFQTGLTHKPLAVEDFSDYDVVVVQQPYTPAWTRVMRRLQADGVRVLIEIDDYIHAVRKIRSHELRDGFTKEMLRVLELNMRMADGVICSTDYLARRYGSFNDRIWVCRNGIDLRRYDLDAPTHDGFVIGWSGGVGHRAAVGPWLPVVADVLRARPAARFMTVGAPFAEELAPEFGPERALSVGYSALEAYPAAMTMFDVALAPSGRNNLFKGKSDLRWLEASAMGIPAIADPGVYPEIEHGATGFHATEPAEVRNVLLALIDDLELGRRVGAAARVHVREHRSAQAAARQWAAVLTEVAGSADKSRAAA
jgi:glycosyltransferase involved in cell wall biosynthesis